MFQPDYSSHGSINSFFYRVYAWMSAAMLITASVAYYVATTPAVYRALNESAALLIGLFVVQIALVMILSFLLPRMNFPTAVALFIAYAISVGATLSSLVLVYTGASLFATFLVTAGMFGCMAIYGYTTNADLTAVGSIGIMGMIGIIIGMLVNLWLKSQLFDYILSGIGVFIFAALTAYDMQKLKQIGSYLLAQQQDVRKMAIFGALTLYLDFLNLFLFLLNFMGKKRND